MYAVHLRLIGKPLVHFLLVIIKLFSLGVTTDVLRAKVAVFAGGYFGGTFQVEGDVPTNGTAEFAGLKNAGLENDGLEMTDWK